MQVKIDNWAVACNQNGYMAPEVVSHYLVGEIREHPDWHGEGHLRFGEPKLVTTSRMAGASGRVVTTRSGTEYRLGRISPEYRAWLRQHKPNWNWRRPFGNGKDNT